MVQFDSQKFEQNKHTLQSIKSKRDSIAGCYIFFSLSTVFNCYFTCGSLFVAILCLWWTEWFIHMRMWVSWWCWSVLDCWSCQCVAARPCVYEYVRVRVHHRNARTPSSSISMRLSLFDMCTHFTHQNSISEIGLVPLGVIVTTHNCMAVKVFVRCMCVYLCDTHQMYQTIAQTHPNRFIHWNYNDTFWGMMLIHFDKHWNRKKQKKHLFLIFNIQFLLYYYYCELSSDYLLLYFQPICFWIMSLLDAVLKPSMVY